MKRVEYFIGTGFDKNGAVVWDVEKRTRRAREILALEFGSFTQVESKGYWRDGPATVSKEGLVFVVYTDHPYSDIYNMAQELAKAFNQKAVGVGHSAAQFYLIDQEGDVL